MLHPADAAAVTIRASQNYGRTVADRLPALVSAFIAAVAKEQGLDLPPVAWARLGLHLAHDFRAHVEH